jgi:hypothetical protein
LPRDAIIGTNIVAVDDSINTTSVNVPVTARSIYDDTVITAFLDFGSVLIGTAQGIGLISSDPYAGRTTAGLYFSVVPPSGGFGIDTAGLRIDSVVMVLPYGGFSWGDTVIPPLDSIGACSRSRMTFCRNTSTPATAV